MRRRLLAWDQRFSPFAPDSELARLNRDRRARVPVSPLMARLAEAAVNAAALSRGLVDATLLSEIQEIGPSSGSTTPADLERILELAPSRRPAGPHPDRRPQAIEVDRIAHVVSRPPGVMLDARGLAKGLFADILASVLAGYESYVLDCAGHVRLGGIGESKRPIRVFSPFDDRLLHEFEIGAGAAATSGIGKHSWIDPHGEPAHHLLDPATGRPAFTGVVAATALAPTGVEADIRAKAAVLAGPEAAPGWLLHGGLVVFDDGSHQVLVPQAADLALTALPSDGISGSDRFLRGSYRGLRPFGRALAHPGDPAAAPALSAGRSRPLS